MSIIITVVTNILCVKEFVFGVILVRIFPPFSRIWTEYREILRILTLFTQWSWRKWNGNNHKGRTIFYHSWGSRHSIFLFFFISIMLYQETQLLCHLNYALPENTVIMWTDITDSLLIALGCKHFLNTLKNWLEVG